MGLTRRSIARTPQTAASSTPFHVLSVAAVWLLAGGSVGCGQLLGLDEDRSRIGGDEDTTSVCACDDGDPCTADTCGADGCVHTAVADGVAPTQIEGDCQRVECAGGVATHVAHDDDVPAADACATWSCSGGSPLAAPVTRGDSCGSSGGFCDGAGSCVECLEDAHCGGGVDSCGGAGAPGFCGCTPLSCDDLDLSCGAIFNGCHGTLVCDNGQIDGGETDVDCGGSVKTCGQRCSEGLGCAEASDCVSAFCGGGRCTSAWQTTAGGVNQAIARAVASSTSGSVVVVGDFTASALFDGVTLTTATHAGFAVMFDETGALAFGVPLADQTSARDVAIDGAGNVVIVGALGDRPHIEKRDGAGKPLWTLPMAVNGIASATAVAIDDRGQTFVVGDLDGTLMTGQAMLSGTEDVFFLELDTTGAVVDARTFSSVGTQRAVDVAAGPLGQIAIASNFVGTVTLGGAVFTSGGDWDGYVTVLGETREAQKSIVFSGPSAQDVGGVVYDGPGHLFVAGSFHGAMQLVTSSGSGNVPVVSAGAADVFVTRLEDVFLAPVWIERYGDAQQQEVAGIASDVRGGVTVAGSFSGTLDLGGSPLFSAGGMDAFFATFDQDGGVSRSRRFGDQQAQHASGVAMSAFGAVFLAGAFRGTVDFGQGPVTSVGSEDAFLAAL